MRPCVKSALPLYCTPSVLLYIKSDYTTEMDVFEQDIADRIKPLTQAGKLAFAYSVCVRLVPHYKHFSSLASWGNLAILESAINTIRQLILRQPANSVKQLFEDVEEVTPDTEDFPEITCSFALNSCCAILDTLTFVIDKNDQAISTVATYARDTLDFYIQEIRDFAPNDPNLERKIVDDPYMIAEVEHMRMRIDLLKANSLTEELLDELATGKMIDLNLVTH
jgi:uncharacterized protein YjaG (DUF416 family)